MKPLRSFETSGENNPASRRHTRRTESSVSRLFTNCV